MSYSTIFHLLSNLSKKTGIRCVLIGGFAVNFYKVSRHTADVDFLVTKNDFEKIEPFLKEAGYKVDFSQEVFCRLTGTGKTYLIDTDFMFVDKETLDKIIKDAKKVKIAEKEFLVPSLNNMIALKLHSLKHNLKYRENRDLADIIDLIKANKVNFSAKKFKELCLKYGTQELYSMILKRLA